MENPFPGHIPFANFVHGYITQAENIFRWLQYYNLAPKWTWGQNEIVIYLQENVIELAKAVMQPWTVTSGIAASVPDTD